VLVLEEGSEEARQEQGHGAEDDGALPRTRKQKSAVFFSIRLQHGAGFHYLLDSRTYVFDPQNYKKK
jgi:hypothetical protein